MLIRGRTRSKINVLGPWSLVLSENIFPEISATALCATAWLSGPEFCVLSSVLEFWLMVYGFVFEKLPFGGGVMALGSNRSYGLTPHPAH